MASRDRVPDRFESFELSIEKIGESYRAQVTESPVGPRPAITIEAAKLDFAPTAPPAKKRRETPTRDVRRRQPAEPHDLRRLGERLFRTVFTGPIANVFELSVQAARHQRLGLRVCLHLGDTPDLVALPWEALWDPQERAFLADQPDLAVVRSLRVPSALPSVRPVEPRLRLLALLPSPRGERKLSGAAEWTAIQTQLQPLFETGELVTDQVEPPTLDTLADRIDDPPCHVLHVVAHGSPGRAGDGGALTLENAEGEPDRVTGVELARALERQTALRLVMLNACHGARATIEDAFDGMAQHLLSRGVPAVVAMRTAISDPAAVAFAAVLYRALAEGRTIEAATVEARRMLSLGEHRKEWTTPVLYLRSENVRLFDAARSIPVPEGSEPSSPRGLLTSEPQPRATWPRWAAGAIAALLTMGVLTLTLLLGPKDDLSTTHTLISPEPQRQPPLNLYDLVDFVDIEPGVLDLVDRRLVVDQPFAISTKEVTRRDWQEIMKGRLRPLRWGRDLPITYVTPAAVSAFLAKLNELDKSSLYRLPTAVEWEYAARAGSADLFFFGNDPQQLPQYGNCKTPKTDGYDDSPAPVGRFKPNNWGLRDVHGNVAEWVQWPPDLGPAVDKEGRELALRLGGSFDHLPENCAFSDWSPVLADAKRKETGFRVVKVPAPASSP